MVLLKIEPIYITKWRNDHLSLRQDLKAQMSAINKEGVSLREAKVRDCLAQCHLFHNLELQTFNSDVFFIFN